MSNTPKQSKDAMKARAADLQAKAEKIPGRNLANEFVEFIIRGNVVSLAVAVVIGAAFTAIVTAFTASFLTPLIAAIGGQPDFSALFFTINDSKFMYGNFFNALISFLITAAVVFFFVVKPMNHLLNARKTEEPVKTTTKECTECLSSIPLEAKRCAFCTSEQSVATA